MSIKEKEKKMNLEFKASFNSDDRGKIISN